MEDGVWGAFLHLPLPALSVILFWLDVPSAFSLARKNRRLFMAFCDETSWKRRCNDLQIDNAKDVAWMSCFRNNRPWHVHIKTIAGRRPMFVDYSFTIDCTPSTTVFEFKRLVSVHKENVSAHYSRWGDPYEPKLIPFDEYKLRDIEADDGTLSTVSEIEVMRIEEHVDGLVVDTGEYGTERRPLPSGLLRKASISVHELNAPELWPALPPSPPPPNCSFNDKDQSATIQAAGLCQGAILQQYNRNFVD